ncbi:MAG: NAD(+) diphosphatase [Alphaproteobacteria bacterium]
MKSPNIFAGDELDRVGLERKDPMWVEAQFKAADTRVLPLWRNMHFVLQTANDSAEGGADAPPTPLLLDVATARRLAPDGDMILLGVTREGETRFALDLSHLATPLDDSALKGAKTGDLRDLAGALPHAASAMLAQARALVQWHAAHPRCARCGGRTESREGGHVRVCLDESCKASHFPRTDPAVIMLVTRGERCLLARRAGNAQPMYSTLAGFVEPAESLEEAVAREVLEEVGLRVTDVAYQSSQPWPFPAQLMLGFRAEAASDEFRLQEDEIMDARWFTRDDLRRVLAAERTGEPALFDGGEVRMARAISIARRLVLDWLDEA